ncbi:hypothetical protein FRACYDRAFT_257711 [Fragilariopsis cylindrus CCMP1102]|uniref:Uncharacterized protein n=1 Tax=Fragilariopsis cylindrus CCMP1102 TaxID=635003 RepID=A0A1E7EIZ2_9STRA|nr:hypothetical protein FRACYDRAFT_257711 [Fragilariopsis cylindrus CCMP1102]|eukprot:OEU05868.1 hypothetical protein FRACYDRAFT_257711 [Fragilariopsis cylindrus CCMP1102]
MILEGVVPGKSTANGRYNNMDNTKNQSKSKGKSNTETTTTTTTTTDENERKMLEKLWSYVNNLQRARKTKGDTKAANALAYYLHNNKVDEKINPILMKEVKFDDEDDGDNNDEDAIDDHQDGIENIVAVENNSNTNTSSSAIQLLSSIQEVLERALIPALRQAGESHDYKMILRLISGSVAFANNHPILTPRIFGEAIHALSQTKSNAAKLKSVWNIMIGNTTTTTTTETGNNNNDDSNRLPLFLSGPPTAFELNIVLKSMASRGKSKACIDLYRQHSIRGGSSTSPSLPSSTTSWLSVPSSSSYSTIYIHPDAYTISILLSILADSISINQMMCDPIDFSATTIENATTAPTIPIPKTTATTDSNKSMWSNIKSLSYSTCWQWNAAMDLFSTLPDDNNKNKNGFSSKNKDHRYDNNEMIRWRNNYVYSSLLKLQDKAEDLCNRRISSSSPSSYYNSSNFETETPDSDSDSVSVAAIDGERGSERGREVLKMSMWSQTTVSNARFGQVWAADGVILGSSVENANTHPDLQKWINDSWDITPRSFQYSWRGKGPMNKSDSDNDDIPNMIIVGGNFMVMSILVHRRSLMNLHSVQSEIDDVGDNNDGDDYSNTLLYFSKECHESKQTIVHPLFLNKVFSNVHQKSTTPILAKISCS